MKWSSAWVAVAFLTLAGGCASAGSQPPAAAQLDVDYEIYSMLLDTIFAKVRRDTFYVHEKTSPFGSGAAHESVPRKLREISVSPELIEAYVAANADSLALDADRFQAQSPAVLTSSSPGDIKIGLSRIGFSADRSEAIVHYIFRCGTRCGWAYVMRLEKVDGSWVFREGSETMVF